MRDISHVYTTRVSCLLPVFLLSCFSHISLNTVSPCLPRLLLPYSRNYAVLFCSMSSTTLSTCPVHCNLLLTRIAVKLLCTPISSLNSNILLLSALVTLAFFVASCFRTFAAFIVIVRRVPKFPFRTGIPE